MNAKKKNKKANKPPNPNPPQNEEIAPKKEKNVEEIQSKCEVIEPFITPEVPSEVMVIPPVSETSEVESETPKKPKRNKGKNKKQEKVEETVEIQEKLQEVQVESIPTENSQKITTEVQEVKCDPFAETTVVPSARKKKNKKKTQEKPSEEIEPTADYKTAPKIETTEVSGKVDTDIQELLTSKPETPKEAKKKKNKKKNRNDSERSDKSENILTCTSAFQQILTDDSSKKDPIVIVSEDKIQCTDTKLESKNDKAKDKNLETVVMAETKNVNEEPKEINEAKDDNKSKKKNKKDKKQQHKDITEALKHDTLEEIPNLVDVLTENTVQDEPKHDSKESLQSSSDSQKVKEHSPKPKAKIAKPVEKKQKGKLEALSSENLLNIESSSVKKEDKKVVDFPTEPKLQEQTPIVNLMELQVQDNTSKELSSTPIAMENISVPSEQTMGKKRKKSPKPQKKQEIANTKLNIEPDTAKSEIIPVFKSPADISLFLPSGTLTATSDSIKMPTNPSDALLPDMQMPENEPETDVAKINLLEKPVTPEMTKDNEGFELKTNKKKKKTPKIPQVETSLEIKETIILPSVDVQKPDDKDDKLKEKMEQKIDIPVESFLHAEVEVQSVRTESEASSCDIIPKVHFVRSSSQNFDSNNNTVIQELVNVDALKVSDLQLTPLIQGSGETPVPTPTPEMVSSGIRMTDIETKASTEEKTDIKSKMMEVNQDMEDLRLSIERSLAEFTALEKCEKETEEEPTKDVMFKKEKSPYKDSKKEIIKGEQMKLSSETKENISLTEKINEPEIAISILPEEETKPIESTPVCPARKDNKSKGKSKKKGKQESTTITATTTSAANEPTNSQSKNDDKKEKFEEKSEKKSETTEEKGKQQSTAGNNGSETSTSKNADNESTGSSGMILDTIDKIDFEPIENFEDALTSSIGDVNLTFEMIAEEIDNDNIEFQKKLAANKPEINITEPADDKDKDRTEKINPVSQPKNLLGHPDIPVQSNKTDYKKEKNKTPNARQARVKIKDSTDIETKQSKESQTDNKRSRKTSDKSIKESFSKVKNDNEEYVYKYSFRKVFLQSVCHVCNKDLGQVRVPCGYCSLVFYCGVKHKDEDWPQHQALCFAVSTLAHMKDQKHIYADAQNCTGQDYRLLRMQMIVSCEKVLKKRLVPWEQEVMLYPRMCAEVACREWRQGKLKDCDGCGQISYCAANPEHLPKSHARWCKSYSLYQRLVGYQQTKGRLEPRLPTRVMTEDQMPGKMNEVLAAMYEEKIDMNDIQYASLTQLATAPLTTAYCLQLCRTASGITNGVHKHPFTIHVVGAELQFEADALNKWETFFLHLRPDVDELRVVLVSPALNPGNLPLDLLGKIKLCDNCQQSKRRIVFKFEDNKNYFEYRSSEDFINPDIICAFNPSIQRSSVYNGKDPWPASLNAILKLKTPFIITSYTLSELRKDIARIKQISEIDFKFILEPGFNSFASVRPDRNFISDDEMPLLFKNYCVSVVVGC